MKAQCKNLLNSFKLIKVFSDCTGKALCHTDLISFAALTNMDKKKLVMAQQHCITRLKSLVDDAGDVNVLAYTYKLQA